MKEYSEYDSPFGIVFQQAGEDIANKADDMCYEAVIQAGVTVNKAKLIEALEQDAKRYREAYRKGYETAKSRLYSAKQVADIITEILGDRCACNFNDIDEWLPQCCEAYGVCDYETEPCWEKYLKYKDKRTKE